MTALRLPRRPHARPLALLATSIVLVAATQAAALLRGSPAADQGAAQERPAIDLGPVTAPGAPPSGSVETLTRIDRSIGAWTANLAANDGDFLSAANLAHLYEARARLRGDLFDYTRAAEAASRSLAIEPGQLDVRALHARVQLATHDFGAALAEAEALDRTAPDQPAILAIIADAKLELGDVDAAEALYRRIEDLAPGAAISARLARISFLRGDVAGAVAMAEASFDAATADGLEGPALSWYAYLGGVLSMSAGSPERAATWFDRALTAWPESHLALAGRARAAAALGDVDAALAGYRAAIAIAPQPDSLAALGDLLALRGDRAGADEQFATVRAIAQLQGAGGAVYNRQLALFETNHGGDVAGALALAERELEERKDVYGYDALAWALLANGRAAEADVAMSQALAVGTRDAMLLLHAGEIARELGDVERARILLEEALAIRGALDPLSFARATSALESLR